MRTIETKRVEFKRKNTQKFGFYNMYIKLLSDNWDKIKIAWKLLSIWQKTSMLFRFLLQFLFKPLKYFYHYKEEFDGIITAEYVNGSLSNYNFNKGGDKYITHYLFRIPFFMTFKKINKTEILDILK